jgi:hypothetical protein
MYVLDSKKCNGNLSDTIYIARIVPSEHFVGKFQTFFFTSSSPDDAASIRH